MGKILLILLLMSPLASCNNKQYFEYSDFPLLEDNPTQINNQQLSIYVYSKTCKFSIEIKQDVLNYIYKTNSLVLKEVDSKTPKCLHVSSLTNIENFCSVGTPAIVKTIEGKVTEIIRGKSKVLQYIEDN